MFFKQTKIFIEIISKPDFSVLAHFMKKLVLCYMVFFDAFFKTRFPHCGSHAWDYETVDTGFHEEQVSGRCTIGESL